MLNIYADTATLSNIALGGVPNFVFASGTVDTATTTIEGIAVTKLDIEQIGAILPKVEMVTPTQCIDAIKYRADVITWASLTANQKLVVAKYLAALGSEIIDVIPDYAERLYNAFDVLCYTRGYPVGESEKRIYMLQAIFIAATNHITFSDVPMPEVLLTFMNVNPAQRGISASNENLLALYAGFGLKGMYKGQVSTGVMDFFTEWVGSEFEDNGLATNFSTNIAAPFQVINDQWEEGGFSDVAEFAAYCLAYIDKGILG